MTSMRQSTQTGAYVLLIFTIATKLHRRSNCVPNWQFEPANNNYVECHQNQFKIWCHIQPQTLQSFYCFALFDFLLFRFSLLRTILLSAPPSKFTFQISKILAKNAIFSFVGPTTKSRILFHIVMLKWLEIQWPRCRGDFVLTLDSVVCFIVYLFFCSFLIFSLNGFAW